MHRGRRVISLLAVASLTVSGLAACGGSNGDSLLRKDSGASAVAENTLNAMASGDWKTVNANITFKDREAFLKAKPSKPLLSKTKVNKTDTNGSYATATVTYTLDGKMTQTSLTLTQSGGKWKITDGLPLANLGGRSTNSEDDSGRAQILQSLNVGDFYPATANGVKYPITADTVYAIPGTYKFTGTDPKGMFTAEWSSTIEGKDKGVASGLKSSMIHATDKFKTKVTGLVRKDLGNLDVCGLIDKVRGGNNPTGTCRSGSVPGAPQNGDQHITGVDGITIQSVDAPQTDGGNPGLVRLTLAGTVSVPKANVQVMGIAASTGDQCYRLASDFYSVECETYSNQPLDLTGAAYWYRLEDGTVVYDTDTEAKIQQFAADGVQEKYGAVN